MDRAAELGRITRKRRRWKELGARQPAGESAELAIARATLLINGSAGAGEPSLSAELDVASLGERGERSRIVRVGRGESELRVAARGLELTGGGTLEHQHSRRKQSPTRKGAWDLARNGAEIFADDQCAMANALQCQNPQEVARRVADVGTFRAGHPTRNPKEAK